MCFKLNSDAFSLISRFLILFVISQYIQCISASLGDNLVYFRQCLKKCVALNCSTAQSLIAFEKNQPFHLWLFGWNCFEECKYDCQWTTVCLIYLQSAEIPNWTFHRFLGIQEPASALFSIFNLITNYLAWKKYCKTVLSISSKQKSNEIIDPYFVIITLNAVICMHAWLWSTVFHVHDTSLTE
ncbi:post-GPI attachment to proteins factor 3-like protein, partial [Leptotrombidium deliense]